MTSYDIAETWKDAVRDSIAINNFCSAALGGDPKLFMDVDPRDMPGKKDAPYIAFLPHGSPSGGQGEEEIQFAVSVFVAMVDDTVTKSGREVVYAGRGILEREFNPLVVEAIEGVGDLAPEKHSWEVAQLDSGFFFLENIFTVNLPNTLG